MDIMINVGLFEDLKRRAKLHYTLILVYYHEE